jgi:hypothetical protein
MGFPLLPLGIEFLLTQTISVQSVSIATTMYLFSIGASSRVKSLFYLMLAASILFSAAYGFLLLHHPVPAGSGTGDAEALRDGIIADRVTRYAVWVIGATFFVHLVERFNRHVLNNEPFPS